MIVLSNKEDRMEVIAQLYSRDIKTKCDFNLSQLISLYILLLFVLNAVLVFVYACVKRF